MAEPVSDALVEAMAIALRSLLPDLAKMVAAELMNTPTDEEWDDAIHQAAEGLTMPESAPPVAPPPVEMPDVSIDVDLAPSVDIDVEEVELASQVPFDSEWIDLSGDISMATEPAWAAFDRNAYVEALASFAYDDERCDVLSAKALCRFMLTADEAERSNEIGTILKIASENPTCARTLVSAARMHLELRELPDAMTLLERAIALPPRDAALTRVRERAARMLEELRTRQRKPVAPQPPPPSAKRKLFGGLFSGTRGT